MERRIGIEKRSGSFFGHCRIGSPYEPGRPHPVLGSDNLIAMRSSAELVDRA